MPDSIILLLLKGLGETVFMTFASGFNFAARAGLDPENTAQ